jgi:hypothetical protein
MQNNSIDLSDNLFGFSLYNVADYFISLSHFDLKFISPDEIGSEYVPLQFDIAIAKEYDRYIREVYTFN